MIRVPLLGVMRSPAELMRGLSNRPGIPENGAMVFLHGGPRYVHYHMRNTLIPLDIAFVGASGQIDHVAQMLDQTARSSSPKPASMAIEMNLGAFERLGVSVGQFVVVDEQNGEIAFHDPESYEVEPQPPAPKFQAS